MAGPGGNPPSSNAATQIVAVSGNNQVAVFGAPVPEPVVVKATNAQGSGVAGVKVSFTVSTGGGSVAVVDGTTDASGLASTSWTLGTASASQSLTVSSAGLFGSPVQFSATGGTLVTAEGATVSIEGGGSVAIPAAAVSTNIVLTAQRTADPVTTVNGVVVGGSTVRFGPSGTVFAGPVRLTLPRPPGAPSELGIAYYDSSRKQFILLDDATPEPGNVSATIFHFSKLVVVNQLYFKLQPGQTYRWFMRNCPTTIGGTGAATCADVRRDVKAAFDSWSSIVNVDFPEATNDDAADVHIDFRRDGIMQYRDGTVANAGWSLGDNDYEIQLKDAIAWTPSVSTVVKGADGYASNSANVHHTILHEIGHLLGLKHPFNSVEALFSSGICIPGSRDGLMSYCDTDIPVTPKCHEIQSLRDRGFTLRQGAVKCANSLALVGSSSLGAFSPGATIPVGTIKVKFSTADGTPVPHFPVLVGTFVGSGSLATKAAYTGSDGVASLPPWTLSAAPGEQCAYAFAVGDDRSATSDVKVCATSAVASAPRIDLSTSTVAFATTGSGNPPNQTVQITNGGSGTLTGLAVGSASYGAGQPSGWLAASLSGTTDPATLTLSVTTGSLAAGSYTATLPVSSSAAGVTNSPRNITVTFAVSAATVPVASVTVSPAAVSITVGATQQFSATLKDASGNTLTGRAVTWSTSSVAIASVNASTGLATGVAAGTATISATSEGKIGSAQLSVAASSGATFTTISVGSDHTCAVTTSGTAYCWGDNRWYGQLGDGTSESRTTPVSVVGGVTFRNVSAASRRTCGVASGGAAYCWGDGNFSGGGGNSFVPVPVPGGLTFEEISAGEQHTCGLSTQGSVKCWGDNYYRQLGNGSSSSSTTPVPLAGAYSFESIDAGGYYTCGVTTDNLAYCWGWNISGQFGNGTSYSSSSTPTPVSGNHKFKQLATSANRTCGLDLAGSAYCWGLLQGVTTLFPTPVAPGLAFQSITIEGHTCALTAAGVAYCWGENESGQLGDGTTLTRLTPTRVAGDHVFRKIFAGWHHTCGLTTADAAYCWGRNNLGQLGDGTTTPRHAPTRVKDP